MLIKVLYIEIFKSTIDFWQSYGYIAYITIMHCSNAIIDDDFIAINKNLDRLQPIALINWNKRGGFSSCVWDTLERY